MIVSILSAAILLAGLWGVLFRKNLIKKIIGLSIMNSGIILLFVTAGNAIGDSPPILTGKEGTVVDPVPQALMLTAIVIGLAVTALAMAFIVRIYGYHGTLDSGRIFGEAGGDGEGDES